MSEISHKNRTRTYKISRTRFCKMVVLHEQMTAEIEEEKNKAIMQERKRSAEKRFALSKKLIIQDRQILEMGEYKRELLQKLSTMFRKKDQYKKNKAIMLEQQELQIEEIERQKEMITQLENQFEAFKIEMTKECKRCFDEGFRLGREVARIEENGLLEELEILKEISHTLQGDTQISEE